MKYPVPVTLKHLGMNIEARITKLCDLFAQQLHSIDRVAEDDGLIDLQLQHSKHIYHISHEATQGCSGTQHSPLRTVCSGSGPSASPQQKHNTAYTCSSDVDCGLKGLIMMQIALTPVSHPSESAHPSS